MKKITCTLLTLVCALCCALGLAACGENNTDGTQTVTVESVALNKTTLILDIGGEETLTATIAPDNATDKTVTWSSSAPTVAGIDNTGKVTAKAEGTATVTAKTVNNKTATCTVTVNAPKTEVTAAEWKQLIEGISNVTVAMGGESFKFDGTSMLLVTVDDGNNNTSMLTKDGEKYYMYVLKDNAWKRTEATADMYNQSINGFSGILSAFADDYTLFTHADGKYTCASLDKTQSFGATITNIEVVFNNSALVSIKFNTPDGLYEIKEIGTTTVEIPANYTESSNGSGAEVTAEQWVQVFDGISNFTVEAYDDNGEYHEIGKFDGSTLLYTNYEGLTVIYRKDGNNYSRYQTFSDIDEWYKGGEEAEEYDYFFEFSDVIDIFKADWNLFTFADDIYTLDSKAKNYPVFRLAYNTFTNVKVTFEDGALIGMEFEASRASDNKTVKVVIKDIGNTTITAPTDYTEI